LDEGGLDVKDLEEKAGMWKDAKMWNTSKEKPFWAMVYCIPVYQNPTGTTLTEGENSSYK